MKIKVKCGYEGVVGSVKGKEYVIEVEEYNEREILKEVLLNEYESEEGIVEYWNGIDCDLNSVEDVVDYIIEDKEKMDEMGLFEGKWLIGEEDVCEFSKEEVVSKLKDLIANIEEI